MGFKCAVYGCRSNYQCRKSDSHQIPVKVSVYNLPNDPLLRKKWLKFINRKDFTPTANTRVCILHFEKRFFISTGTQDKPAPLERLRPRVRKNETTVLGTENVVIDNGDESVKKRTPRLTPDAYPTINPKVSTEKITSYSKYPRQCETCLEYFNNYDSFQKHSKTHKRTASDKQACISNEKALAKQNSDLDYEFIEKNDTDDLVMFSESEGEDEENNKNFPVAHQQFDGEYVLEEPAFGLEDLCRVCGKCEGNMIQIYETEGRNLDLGLKMNKCLPIKVNEDDSLPLSVCQRCVTRVEESFDLSSTCQKTDAMLTEMLAQQKMFLEGQNLPTEESNPPFNFDDEMLNLSSFTVSESDGNLVANVSVPPIDSEPFDSLSRSSSVSLDDAEPFASMETENVFQDVVQSNTVTSFSDEVKVIQCPKCEFIFVIFKHYEVHMLLIHKLYVCKNHLEFETHSKEEFQNHKKECCINQHLCSVCGKIYKLNSQLTAHMRTHGERTFVCEICGKSFYHKRDLQGHKQTHDPILRFTCSICDKKFRFRKTLTLHVKMVHCKSMTYICSMCDISYSSEMQIQNHCNKSHSVEERRKCTISVYTKTSDFQCDICKKYYDTELGVKSHRKLHTHGPRRSLKSDVSPIYTMNKQCQCDFCKKYFTKYYLKIHMGTHLGVKEFVCHCCDESFNYSNELTEHINAVHLKTISFPCNECDKSFFSKRKLLMHTRGVHRGVEYKGKKVDCTVCNKTFSKKKFLMVHMRVHTGEKPFSCKFCGKAFTQSGDRNRHEKNMHVDK